MHTPRAVPSPVARRQVAAFLMTTFLDELRATRLARTVARYRENDGADTGEFEVIA